MILQLLILSVIVSVGFSDECDEVITTYGSDIHFYFYETEEECEDKQACLTKLGYDKGCIVKNSVGYDLSCTGVEKVSFKDTCDSEKCTGCTRDTELGGCELDTVFYVNSGYYVRTEGCVMGDTGASIMGIGGGLVAFGVIFCICCCWICIPIGILLLCIGLCVGCC